MAGTEIRKTKDNTTLTRAFGYILKQEELLQLFSNSSFAAEKNMRHTVKCRL
jgi:hypothetical protein